jgi:hypothetical protein
MEYIALHLDCSERPKGITNVMAATAHPGFTATNLGETFFASSNWFLRQVLKAVLMLPVVQTAKFGALPTLYAAVGENVKPNDYFGPPLYAEARRLADQVQVDVWQHHVRAYNKMADQAT